MTFPVSPANNETATVNGITYVYSSANNAWTRVTANSLTLAGNLSVGGISSNLTPTANVIYNLGSPTRRWKDLWLSGNTIFIGSEAMSVSPAGQWSFTSGGATVNLGSTAAFNPPEANIGGVLRASGNIVAAATTVSTSTTTGALVVNGGAGIDGNIFASGIIDAAGNIIADSGTASTNTTTGALVVNGGAGISGRLNVGGNVVAASGTNSTSTTTGALVVNGGVGISGNLSLGSQVTTTLVLNNANFANQIQFWNAGVERARIGSDSVGNFDILVGSTSAVALEIAGSGAANVVVHSTTTSTSTTTGALVVRGGSGFSGNIFTSGWIIPSGNVTQNLGSTTAWWNLVYGRSVQAQYADLAENYVTDKNYVPGTVVVFGGDAEITATTTDHDPRVAGVISTDPAYLMNAATTGQPVALTGRVPCMVLGPVDKGDRLVTSKMSGVAQRLIDSRYTPGCIFAKSLEKIERSEVKLIEVAVGRD